MCKLETDVNYCFRGCACCCVEIAHFVPSAILTSCWHQDCWHELTTPVRLLSPEGGDSFMSTVEQVWFGKCLSAQLGIRKTPDIKGFERRPTASINSLVAVSMNLSLLLNTAHRERRETESA